jgi:hypothetical protein
MLGARASGWWSPDTQTIEEAGRTMIDMKCPNCGVGVQFHDLAAGLVRRCPKCKGAIRVTPTGMGTDGTETATGGSGKLRKEESGERHGAGQPEKPE